MFRSCGKVSTDTRQEVKDSVFFALSGENFDGNIFAEDAIAKGAKAVVIDNPDLQLNYAHILVDDVLLALQELAVQHLKSLTAKILAITGSNGKTTTKEIISSVLQSEKNIVATKGNLNNHIGVPLSILNIKEDTEIAIIEMGANHIGEIKRLCEIATPNVGIITNIGKAHLEGFGSFEGVLTAKNELFQAIKSAKGEIILNSDDKLLGDLAIGINSFSYGTTNSDVMGRIIQTNPTLVVEWLWNSKKYLIKSNLYGSYNFPNIMAAIASGLYFGINPVNICRAVEGYKPDNNRSQQLKTKKNKLILDAYNANPVSMANAISSFRDYGADSPVLILGDMFELGESSRDEHLKVIDILTSMGFDEVYLAGKEFHGLKETNTFKSFATSAELKNYLTNNTLENKNILIKGSRGMKLESLLDIL